MMEQGNEQALHQFIEGWKTDFDDHAESQKSYIDAFNGRLYSENGVLSYSSAKGTVEVYNNPGIVKYLGYWAFNDELVVIVKQIKEEEADIIELVSPPLYFEALPLENIEWGTEILDNTEVVITTTTSEDDEFDFDNEISCTADSNEEIDFDEYYTRRYSPINHRICEVENEDTIYENNKKFADRIYSFKRDENGTIYDTVIWSGNMNIPINGKIVTLGIYENNFYKRVYFTDYNNAFRVINLKDKRIKYRRAKEFETFQSSTLLQPKIDSISQGGQIKAGTSLYAYRLITANGQTTEFSPFSEPVRIIARNGDIDFRGGDVTEVTDTSVRIKCNVLQYQDFQEIEAVVIEYQALGAPNAVRSLGIKRVNAVNYFDHYGNESEFDNDLTLNELLIRKNTWRYVSDLASKNNKLFASGLRNNPLPQELQTISKDFALHGWDELGQTHLCLINPKPSRFRYIDVTNVDKKFYIKRKVYRSIQVFGSFTLVFKNIVTGEFIETTIEGSTEKYLEFIDQIYEWLEQESLDGNFLTKFPNLKLEQSNGSILFSPLDENFQTDLSDYVFSYNTTQVIEDLSEEIEFINLAVDITKLVYGGESLGFSKGNGIRITFKSEYEDVASKAISELRVGQNIMNIKKPSMKKGFFKGEIYRLAINFYDKNGYQLFAVPIGDIKVPELYEFKKYLIDGQPIISIEAYVNSFVSDNKLKVDRTLLNAEVRLSCEMQKLVSSYQLVYVERNENNRTILCQGLSAPMERVNTWKHTNVIGLLDEIDNKWNLPYYGGPTYDGLGLKRYDEDPYMEVNNEWTHRVVTNRSLIYFDSPDIIYDKISANKIRNGNVQRVLRANTDHTPGAIRQNVGEIYPKFSRKIYMDSLDGVEDYIPEWMNFSVFSKQRSGINNLIPIEKAEGFGIGEIKSGIEMNSVQDVSNNAVTLGVPAWFYSGYGREDIECNGEGGLKSELWMSSNVSIGHSTVVIKTSEDIFSNEFISQEAFNAHPEIRDPYHHNGETYDTHAIININMNNEESIYGGRTELAYSKNTYIPLSDTIPVLQDSNEIQEFTVRGDTFTTLFIRNKNFYNAAWEPTVRDMHNSGNCDSGNISRSSRWGAWAYAVVLETQVEPRLTHKDVFYKKPSPWNFLPEISEIMNTAYYQENNLRSFLPKPFRYKDDPNLGNIVSVSKTKLTGDFVDNWTEFPVNNFYELERDRGVALNIVKQQGDLFVIQEDQTSQLIVDAQTFVNTDSGNKIAIQQGDGTPISDHKPISNYGTLIRRSIIENDFGFVFIDENKIEIVQISKPLLANNQLSLKFQEYFKDNPIIDVEGYHDDVYKESNLRVRTKDGTSYLFSYNEAFKQFNGKLKYDNDIYMVWNNNIFSPKAEVSFNQDPGSKSLHQLNEGLMLNFFDNQETLRIKIVTNIMPAQPKIFPHMAALLNIDYPIKKITLKTSLGLERVIEFNHYRYKIREGVHSVPLKNRMDIKDLRGKYMEMEVEIESLNNSKINVFSLINFVRNSYI